MKLALAQGAYTARSIIAEAQRCINLYPEINPGDAPFPMTHYPTPGLTVFGDPSLERTVRGLYTATNGKMYAVIGPNVYYVSAGGFFTLLGTIDNARTFVSMVDNRLALVIVDGSEKGYVVRLSDNAFRQIDSEAFYGSNFVQYADGYFIFNRPGTQQFYISGANVTYDMLTLAGKVDGGSIVTPGAIAVGTYTNVPLTGGSGTGALATVIVSAGNTGANEVTVTNGGEGYTNGDILGVDLSQSVAFTFGAGTGYTDGFYADVTLNLAPDYVKSIVVPAIVVSGGVVTSVTNPIIMPGLLQSVGLIYENSNGTLGAGSGFSMTVSSITSVDSGLQYEALVTSSAFDPLDIASKTGGADNLVAAIVNHREIWLIGEQTTEVWYNTGAADFTYGIMPGVFIQHGCAAVYSIAQQDLSLFWVSKDPQGQALILMGTSYSAKRISTHAIEVAIQAYPTVSDAIGYTYQQDGHVFYVLTFPRGNATWVYDVSTELWHQRSSRNDDGKLMRHRSNCACAAYGYNLVGDYENGLIYRFNLDAYTDNGVSIPRIRSFPHIQNESKRVMYRSFTADIEVGNAAGTLQDESPMVSLRWSDNRGKSYGNAIEQPLGSAGQYIASVQWNRLGMARDRVFELSWSANVKTALNGAFVEASGAAT